MDDQSVLVVGAAPALQDYLQAFLLSRGYPYVLASSPEEALDSLAQRNFRFTVVDLDLDPADPADLIRRLKAQRGEPGPVIGITTRTEDTGEFDAAALDTVLHAPIAHADLDRAIADAPVMPPAARELAVKPTSSTLWQEIELWRSRKMRDVRQIVNEAAAVDVTVLITGETGTGKEVVARAIQSLSARRTGAFVKVNCAAVPRELLESELFGHERGAFTGAHKQEIGKFEAAHNGTIFLDEIGDLHPTLQAKLLHVLQDGVFSRVGGKSTLHVDVRIIAATNQDLERAALEGRFREDLYYRLNVVRVNVPPLRERIEEIPGFIQYFVQKYSKLYRREGFSIPTPVMDRLLQHRYRGNVRELENLIKRMIVLGDPHLTRTYLPPVTSARATRTDPTAVVFEVSLKDIVRGASMAAERDAIRKVLEQTGWNRVRAAKALKISYRGLLYKMKRVGLREEALPRRQAEWGGGFPA